MKVKKHMHTKKNRESINTTWRNFRPGITNSVEAGETALLVPAKLLPSVLSVKLPSLEKLEAVKDNTVFEAAAALPWCTGGSRSKPSFWSELPWSFCIKVLWVVMKALHVVLIWGADPVRTGKLLDLTLSSCFSGCCPPREQGRWCFCFFAIPAQNMLIASLVWADLPIHNWRMFLIKISTAATFSS